MHIAIVGCGQLSRMLALAGIPMGLKFSFIADAGEDSRCVEGLGTIVRWQPSEPVSAIYDGLGQPDRITVEKEQVDVSLLSALQAYCPVHPNPQAFATCQHRYQEKQLLDKLGIGCAAYLYGQPTEASAAKIPLPVVVKSCREGYDGKNQWVLKHQQEVDAFSQQAKEQNYIVEQWIPFDKEISQVSVRGANGEMRHYPLAENRHEQGILKQSVAPAEAISEQLCLAAQDYMCRIMRALDYVGVMAMECFVVKDQLLVNELAPRVHNSGHWTQSGSKTCQFTNHLRAIAGLPLGSTDPHGVTGMVNLIGTIKPPLASLPPNAALHWYNKAVRPGRKLGHINFTGANRESLIRQMEMVLR
ncbi:5-(carboxyamino)imidazole ribonucleotide synthase [Spartinivicinus poritis]|uniref:N5-carboxyaminoimidazole ribonucleotide synthase n=1 Tax=Spartinivicinus poritis TaxID=2994640 RepID=A0ABT5U6J4_9GAMM|nr:5-(carboxyamino)imidazole ribonucleotide synthase [Spartinivicinus sp. A2-2]MDE1460799.1 5-(carboxyamino)imidazole ribonucleotide synthase [Spartinivicinus sp. A2-2]